MFLVRLVLYNIPNRQRTITGLVLRAYVLLIIQHPKSTEDYNISPTTVVALAIIQHPKSTEDYNPYTYCSSYSKTIQHPKSTEDYNTHPCFLQSFHIIQHPKSTEDYNCAREIQNSIRLYNIPNRQRTITTKL